MANQDPIKTFHPRMFAFARATNLSPGANLLIKVGAETPSRGSADPWPQWVTPAYCRSENQIFGRKNEMHVPEKK